MGLDSKKPAVAGRPWVRNPAILRGEILSGNEPRGARNHDSDFQTLAAAALAGYIGIAETEGFVQAFLDEIDLGPVDQLEAFLIDAGNEVHGCGFDMPHSEPVIVWVETWLNGP